MWIQVYRQLSGFGRERVIELLDRLANEARELAGDPGEWRRLGFTFAADRGDVLFRKAARFFDVLCQGLNDAGERGRASYEGLDLASLEACGLRARDEAWETDYLALEYALSRDPHALVAALVAAVSALWSALDASQEVLCAA